MKCRANQKPNSFIYVPSVTTGCVCLLYEATRPPPPLFLCPSSQSTTTTKLVQTYSNSQIRDKASSYRKRKLQIAPSDASMLPSPHQNRHREACQCPTQHPYTLYAGFGGRPYAGCLLASRLSRGSLLMSSGVALLGGAGGRGPEGAGRTGRLNVFPCEDDGDIPGLSP